MAIPANIDSVGFLMSSFLNYYNYHVCGCNVLSKILISTLVPDHEPPCNYVTY